MLHHMTQRFLRSPPPAGVRGLPEGALGTGRRSLVSRDHDGLEREAERAADALVGAGRTPRQAATLLGVDFASIRIHADGTAARHARLAGALAFTRGRDIHFAQGAYQPGNRAGRWLIAHEMTHVAQQMGGATHVPGVGALSAAPAGQMQRRTAAPTRDAKNRVITYALDVFTVDDESHVQAKEVADTLNGFSGTVDYLPPGGQFHEETTVRFQVTIHPPPAPALLEQSQGIRLHYRFGKKRLKKGAYQRAAQRHWIKVLGGAGNRQNLYLGDNRPVNETRSYIKDEAKKARERIEREETTMSRADYQAAVAAGKSEDELYELSMKYHKKIKDLETGEASVRDRIDDPDGVRGSRGTTFPGGVVQMRMGVGTPGTAAYRHNVRLHEFMHLLGRSKDIKALEHSIMSYPFIEKHRNTAQRLTPQSADLSALIEEENPPP